MPGPYNLSGSGIQTLAGPAAIKVQLTHTALVYRDGQANPVNHYDQGLLRLGTANGFYPAFPIDGDTIVHDCPVGTTQLGYALLGGALITVTELTASSTPVLAWAEPDVLSPLSANAVGVEFSTYGLAEQGNVAIPSANVSLLVPFRLNTTKVYTSVWVGNGTTPSGNFDVGVYDASFNLLAHGGSTASNGSTRAIQMVTLSPALTLSVGNYYLAISASATTFTTMAVGSTTAIYNLRPFGCLEAASNFPLATTPTTRAVASFVSIPLFGITNRSLM